MDEIIKNVMQKWRFDPKKPRYKCSDNILGWMMAFIIDFGFLFHVNRVLEIYNLISATNYGIHSGINLPNYSLSVSWVFNK